MLVLLRMRYGLSWLGGQVMCRLWERLLRGHLLWLRRVRLELGLLWLWLLPRLEGFLQHV